MYPKSEHWERQFSAELLLAKMIWYMKTRVVVFSEMQPWYVHEPGKSLFWETGGALILTVELE